MTDINDSGIETADCRLEGNPEAETDVTSLQRRIRQLERDNRMLAIMNKNTEQLRRAYEEEKKLQYLYNDLLLKNSPNMFFLFNERLRFVMCSGACSPLLAYEGKEDLVNKPFCDIFSAHISEDWVKKVHAQNQNVLETQEPCRYDDTILFNDESFIHAQLAVAPIMDDTGACRGTVMSVSDITELTLTKQRAEEAAQSKSSFLANMSHEIRTPMNAVKGLSELLALSELDSLQRNYINNIISSANSLLGIINDVLDFSKIDAKKMELIEAPYNPADLVASVCNVINVRADDKNLLLTISAPPDLPSSLIGDDVRIKQILTNLLTNAVKYTNQGYVHISLGMQQEHGKTYLVCSVEDSGIGIREEELPHLFNAFSRADLHLNRNITGTGLGLAIAKQLTLAMDGDIWVASAHNQGSTFCFRVAQRIADPTPIASVQDAALKRVLLLETGIREDYLSRALGSLGVVHAAASADALADTDLSTFTHCIFGGHLPDQDIRALRQTMPLCRFGVLKEMRQAMSMSDLSDSILFLPVFITDIADFLKKNGREVEDAVFIHNGEDHFRVHNTLVLVVDDNEINLIVGSEMLRSLGAEALCAGSGDEAIEMCMKQRFDIIFMDHMMPGKDGLEAAAGIRASGGLNDHVPIVVLTANVANDMRSFYLQNGMDDFIGKPIEFEDLIRVLSTWLPPEKITAAQLKPAIAESPQPGVKTITPEDLIAAMDNFGLYASDVLRELRGHFGGYILRMEDAGKVLDDLTNTLKTEVSEARWKDFSRDILSLRSLLHGIGARDCANRARKLAAAANNGNIDYIFEDFFSLMGNMYMLEKKLEVIVPLARSGDLQKIPLNVPQYLHGSLEKLGRALRKSDAAEAMLQLAHTAAFSLDMDIDMALKDIKLCLEQGDFPAAIARHNAIFRNYAERIASSMDRGSAS